MFANEIKNGNEKNIKGKRKDYHTENILVNVNGLNKYHNMLPTFS